MTLPMNLLWSSEHLLWSHRISETQCDVQLLLVQSQNQQPAISSYLCFSFPCASVQLWCLECCWSQQYLIRASSRCNCKPLQTPAGKFTHLLTFCRTVCCTKASAEFVLAIVNTYKWALPQRVYEKLNKKSCQVEKMAFHFQTQIAKQKLQSSGFFHKRELAVVGCFLDRPEGPLKHPALGGQQCRTQLSECCPVTTLLKTLSIFSASHRPDPDTDFGWQSSEYFCLFS